MPRICNELIATVVCHVSSAPARTLLQLVSTLGISVYVILIFMCSDLVVCMCPSTEDKYVDGFLASRSQLPRSQECRLFRMACLSCQRFNPDGFSVGCVCHRQSLIMLLPCSSDLVHILDEI